MARKPAASPKHQAGKPKSPQRSGKTKSRQPRHGSAEKTTPQPSRTEGAGSERPQNMPHNGRAEQAPPSADGRSQTERAEEIVDRVAERVSDLTSTWGRKLLRLAARAREEAEDIWAEAQSIRHGEQP
jgi:hypothetical protein